MKLKRLKISELEETCKMSYNEMLLYIGGYSYDGKSCFFNCMEYLGKEVCGKDVDCDTYGNAYYGGDGDYQGTGNMDDYLNGPSLYDQDGNLNQNTFDFFSHYFSTEGSGWATGSDISDLFGGSYEDSAVLGAFQTTDGSTAHCVILKGYDAETNTYSYYDPSVDGSEDSKMGTVNADQMLFAGRGSCK